VDKPRISAEPLATVRTPVLSDPTNNKIGGVPVDLVLGVSITSAALRVVLVEGATGEGATVDRDALDIAAIRTIATDNADDLVDAVFGKTAITAARDNRLQAVGVTWTKEGEATASIVMEALAGSDLNNVVAVSELESADALARGIAHHAGYDDIAVCIVEPDAVVIALVKPDGVLTERIDRPLDAGELARSLITALDLNNCEPDAIFAVGSADDLDLVVSSLDVATASPVISAAEADLALARGAALASANVHGGAAQVVDDDAAASAAGRMPWLTSRVGVLASVLVAAVLTFVVSLSVALGLGLTPDADPGTAQQRQGNNSAGEPPRVAGPPSAAQAAPIPSPPAAPPSPAAPPPEAAPPPADTIAATEAPAPEVAPASEPVFEPPAAAPVAPPPVYEPIAPPPVAPPPAPAYVPPPPPAYVPPAPPVYVPPAPAPNYVPPGVPAYVPPVLNPAPKPRLRDRIIERIPIINRFHEPELPYP
jgi:hypothetical protein